MRTGFALQHETPVGDNMIQTMFDLIQPVLEKGMILAGQYAKACGRDTMLDEDVEYAMKYCIMYKVGESSGSIFQDEDDIEVEEEEIEIVDPEDCPEFKRYSGADSQMKRVNDAYDGWKDWEPESPIQEILKNALDNNEF